MNDTPSRRYLTRKEAATYLSNKYFRISETRLARYATDGIGPPVRKVPGLGPTGSPALYARADLDTWAENFPVVTNDDRPPRPSPKQARQRRRARRVGALSLAGA